MKVKRYIVDDLPVAVQMIRSELGSDAVILNTKEIRVGGFLGMFRKKRMEVIAAIDEAAKKPPPPRAPLAAARAAETKAAAQPPAALPSEQEPSPASLLPASAIRQRYVQQPFADSGRKPANAAAPVPAAEPPAVEQPADAAFAAALKAISQAVSSGTGANSAVAPSQAPQTAATQAAALGAAVQTLEPKMSGQEAEEASSLLMELRSMKEMMTKLSKQQTYRAMPASVLQWSRRLAEQGVEPAYVEQFAEEVSARLEEQGDERGLASFEAARDVLAGWLRPPKGRGIAPATKVVHFVGPTGVGKTTTIAKLAAEQSFNHGRTVGFITADTYRIAAVDQLRTYADILNVPLEVVFSPGELARAYAKLSDRDLLFMDTVGRNYRNELFVSEVNSLLASGEHTETVLVLSMTHKYADMKAVVSQFMKYGVRQLLLTKFDETDSYGAIVNLVKLFGLQISYYTCGQAVPDDIKAFDPEEVVDRLLGGPDDD